jgi:hypothetical protein
VAISLLKSERMEKGAFMDGITDKVVVITGASSRIGEAT